MLVREKLWQKWNNTIIEKHSKLFLHCVVLRRAWRSIARVLLSRALSLWPCEIQGGYIIRISCNARLFFQLMKSFSVMPMDQHLALNGVPLSNNDATLLTLGIKPGSLLLLQVCLKLNTSSPTNTFWCAQNILENDTLLSELALQIKCGRKWGEFTMIKITGLVELGTRLFTMLIDKI